ncbi:periplasmic component of amino acid ABC-type transporter/signal transduction system [Fervidobacterium pennivorans DSM 9078]|uniref:Periplasmic component of amino acid ABC-type transporter/signal transduction system n=1 Tax=Fervidobacterium pennivorans (strain DSM 9078 / Ven5) TaxID=771875 RepID=H9UA30_FERPD|nr:ABC transporter substrate-binding protein [Fervidobacterium pennivorans]AFG34373.1 periplasmic component of amino acid ABC-type transporter/signal transduction system [Fervidobacterium pennivorans DSM 9078]
MTIKNAVAILLLAILLISIYTFGQFLKIGLLLGEPYAYWLSIKLSGIEYDIWRAIGTELNMQVEFYVLPFSVLDAAVLPKLGLDVIAGGIHMTDERKKVFKFTQPYINSGLAIVLRKDIKWDGDIEKITFGVKKGSTGERIVRDWVKSGKKIKYSTFVSNEEIVINLLIKKIDGAFFDYINALYLSKKYGFQVHKDLIYSTNIGAVLLNSSLEKKLNDAISKLVSNGTIQRILTSYVGSF